MLLAQPKTSMYTQEFLHILKQYPDHRLTFEYGGGKSLRPDYHITEVKNVHIDATDCGGRSDSWQETVIQLWESPEIEHHGPSITAGKAMAILDRVNSVQPLLLQSPLKFEYGNPDFHTSQMEVTGFSAEAGYLILSLGTEPTRCKARDLCGTHTERATESACDPKTGCC